jgi:hypothetical protein
MLKKILTTLEDVIVVILLLGLDWKIRFGWWKRDQKVKKEWKKFNKNKR